jgi:shikimate dehydrogenase
LAQADLHELLFTLCSMMVGNTTPLGMTPNIETSPLPKNMIFSKHTFIYDLVYNPRETKLVKDARAQGLFAATGLGMLIEQAALAFEKWTGANVDRTAMRKAVE